MGTRKNNSGWREAAIYPTLRVFFQFALQEQRPSFVSASGREGWGTRKGKSGRRKAAPTGPGKAAELRKSGEALRYKGAATRGVARPGGQALGDPRGAPTKLNATAKGKSGRRKAAPTVSAEAMEPGAQERVPREPNATW